MADGTVARPMAAAKHARPARKVIATNRTARRDFDILETIEAGIVLRGHAR